MSFYVSIFVSVLCVAGDFRDSKRSFGGVVLLKLMEELANGEDEGDKEDKGESAPDGGEGIRAAMAGGAFLCSVPPSGNGPMTKRFIKEVRRGICGGCAFHASCGRLGVMSLSFC